MPSIQLCHTSIKQLPYFLLSKHRTSGLMLFISQNVRPCVHLFFFEVRLNVFLPPLPEVGCPNFLEILYSWGKVMERSSLRFEFFTNTGCKIAAQKKVCLGALLSMIFFYLCFSLCLKVCFPPLCKFQCPNFFNFRNPWGKVMKRNGLGFFFKLLSKCVKSPWQKKKPLPVTRGPGSFNWKSVR